MSGYEGMQLKAYNRRQQAEPMMDHLLRVFKIQRLV